MDADCYGEVSETSADGYCLVKLMESNCCNSGSSRWFPKGGVKAGETDGTNRQRTIRPAKFYQCVNWNCPPGTGIPWQESQEGEKDFPWIQIYL